MGRFLLPHVRLARVVSKLRVEPRSGNAAPECQHSLSSCYGLEHAVCYCVDVRKDFRTELTCKLQEIMIYKHNTEEYYSA